MRVGSQRPRLVSLPENIDNTDAGDEVIEFARRFGMVLDDWQQWVVRYMCAERADGSWAATQSVLLVPRQGGKSAILEVIEMAALFLWEEQHIIYSAHLGKTATDHMRRMRRHLDAVPDFRRQARLLTGKGDERIERTDTGAILEFITRGERTARGGSPNRVIFDEALFLKDDQAQAMVPALSAQSMNDDASASMIYTSSAPLAESSVLHRLRARALSDAPPRMFFAEWSVPAAADLADRDNWYAANPGLGIRISEEWVADNEFGTLSPEAFATERLGVVQEVATATLVPHWLVPVSQGGLWDPDSMIASHRAIALDVTPDRAWSSLGWAGRRADGLLHVEAFDRQDGTGWVVGACLALKTKWGLPIHIQTGSPAASLVTRLREVGVDVIEVPAADHAKAVGQFLDAAVERTLRHVGHSALNLAVENAALRASGDVDLWARRRAKVDISPLVAVTLALGGVPDAVEAYTPRRLR